MIAKKISIIIIDTTATDSSTIGEQLVTVIGWENYRNNGVSYICDHFIADAGRDRRGGRSRWTGTGGRGWL